MATEAPRTTMMTASVLALAAAVIGGLLTAGFLFDIAPLDLWTYPVAAVFAIFAIVFAWVGRSAGVKVVKAGGTFPGWMSLLAFIIAVFTLFLTFYPSLTFVTAQFR